MRGIGTQAVLGDNQFEMRVILTQLGDKALRGVAFAIIFGRAILLDNGLRRQRNEFQSSDMKSRLSGWMSAAPNI